MQATPTIAASLPAAAPTIQRTHAEARLTLTAQVPAARPAQSGTPAARQQDGLHVEVSIAPGQSGSDRTVTYRIRDALSTDGLTYILAPKVIVRDSGRGQTESATTPNMYQRVTPSGIQGTFPVKASALSAQGNSVLLFEVRPVDTRSQRPLPTRYVGVMVRP